ncbi:hypothetical protein FQA47_021949 [Oryzias melastigma]|uniref:Uncharacterized protein n=1 Tax=Oryzias melastigma TaxID=30732 RepID=A0A834C353_ORYME|nr:hypothetical protein FQA47_021949 [Oryzias melastigma]
MNWHKYILTSRPYREVAGAVGERLQAKFPTHSSFTRLRNLVQGPMNRWRTLGTDVRQFFFHSADLGACSGSWKKCSATPLLRECLYFIRAGDRHRETQTCPT